MGIISAKVSGNTDNLDRFLKEMQAQSEFDAIEMYAQKGVDYLSRATPHGTGETANSWYYEIKQTRGGYTVSWLNSHKDDQGTPVVILIQYGHGTGTGGYVQAVDFINPATNEIFTEITDAIWKAVQDA